MTSEEFDIILSKTPKSCNLYVMYEEQTTEIKKDLKILEICKLFFEEGVIKLELEDFNRRKPIYKVEDYDSYKALYLTKEQYEIIKEWLEKC